MEYDFIVHPGADPKVIEMAFEGINGLGIDNAGNLSIKTAFGELKHLRPIIYQEINGKRRVVAGSFSVANNRFGFDIKGYNKNYPLIIDPLTLSYSTYLGGSAALDYEVGMAIAVDSSGNAYVTGKTSSTNFPTQDAFQGTRGGYYDVFVTKFSAAGNTLVYSTYLGGIDDDEGWGIAVDSSGNAYITGVTKSTDFPTDNAFQNGFMGISHYAAFVTKLGSAGDTLIYSTYLGGSGADYGYAIALDASGSGYAYVTGKTSSTDFPTENACQPSKAGTLRDTFVTKFNSSGTSLDYSTYLGGGSDDYGNAIAVDSSGNAYVAGSTKSTDFPTVNPYQKAFGEGGGDAFVTKLNSTGSTLVYSTYLGGSENDYCYGIAVDSSGNAYVTGGTHSTDFPTENAYQGTLAAGAGDVDTFVTKFDTAGNTLSYSTYLGGNGWGYGYGIAVGSSGNAYVTGATLAANFPTQDACQQTYGGERDAFVAKLGSAGDTLIYSTYLGGSGTEYGNAIAVDSSGNAYVTGSTNSTDFPTENPYQQAFGGGSTDVFVAKLVWPQNNGYLMTGILVNNDPGSSYSIFNNADISLQAGDVIQFVGSAEPDTALTFFVDDPMVMESRMIEVTTDGNGTFYYPSTYFEAALTHTLPANAALQFLFDNGSQIGVSTKDYQSQLNDVVIEIDLESIDLTDRVPLDQVPIDADLMEYMRWRQNVNNGQTMSQYDWEAVERGRQKFGSTAEDHFFQKAIPKALYEGIVYGKQTVVCAAGIKAAGASGGALTPVAIKACTPLALHFGQTISHVTIDHYKDTGALSSDEAEFWKGFSSFAYGLTSFIAGGDPDTFDIGDFFYTVFDGAATMLDSSLETSPEGVDYLRTTWQHGGFNEITLLVVPQKKKAMPWIQLLLLSDGISSFLDHFDDGTYTDKWTVLQNGGTITESGTELHVQVPEPTSNCDSAILDCKTAFSGQNLTVEARVKPDGYGGVYLCLKKDNSNTVRFGFNTDDVQYVEFGIYEDGAYDYQHIESSTPYLGTYNTVKIVKTGNQYEAYLNGVKKGTAINSSAIGDTDLIMELYNQTCQWKSGDSDNYFDWVKFTVNP